MFRRKARIRTSSAPISLSYLRITSYFLHLTSSINTLFLQQQHIDSLIAFQCFSQRERPFLFSQYVFSSFPTLWIDNSDN